MNILDFRSNANPEGPPAWLPEAEEAARGASDDTSNYARVLEACSRRFALSPGCFLFAQGANALLSVLPRALGVDAILALPPTYAGYQRAAEAAGIQTFLHSAREEDGFTIRPGTLRADMSRVPGRCLVFLGRPNNPAGIPLPIESVVETARILPGHYLCIDESYVELAAGIDPILTAGRRLPDNLLVLKSLTKALAVPELHLGYLAATPSLIRKVEAQIKHLPASALAEEIAFRAISDPGFFAASAARIAEYRGRFTRRLARIPGVRVERGFANFLLLRIEGADARKTAAEALARGVAFRDYAEGEYLDETRWLRVSIRRDEENERAAEVLEISLKEARAK